MRYELHCGDCLDVLPTLADNSIDSIVCDPPYELGFMGKAWDNSGIAYNVEVWRECLRVLKPGGHLLAFGGSRTYHRLACAVEDAGFEIRDQIMWCYGSGFPKSANISKMIDKAAGAEREVLNSFSRSGRSGGILGKETKIIRDITAPATPEAQQWDGWGTALKPAHEPIVVARKPLAERTVAANVLEWGTGAINVDGCRVGTDDSLGRTQGTMPHPMDWGNYSSEKTFVTKGNPQGRWPANLIHDGSDEVLAGFPVTGGGGKPQQRERATSTVPYTSAHRPEYTPYQDTATGGGSAARFFYCAKASKADRNEGCEGLEEQSVVRMATQNGASGVPSKAMERFATVSRNHHPTVKPTDLMRYLCRLVTPPGGVVLDPFVGSGSTGKGAILEGFRFVGIDQSAEYLEIAKRRIEAAQINAG